jgi:hypothetical protein
MLTYAAGTISGFQMSGRASHTASVSSTSTSAAACITKASDRFSTRKRWYDITDVCWRMLTYADICWHMLTYADIRASDRFSNRNANDGSWLYSRLPPLPPTHPPTHPPSLPASQKNRKKWMALGGIERGQTSSTRKTIFCIANRIRHTSTIFIRSRSTFSFHTMVRNLYMYMYGCIYKICNVCMHIYAYVCMCIYNIYIYIIYVYMYVCMYIRIYIRMSVNATHTHTHTHTHTYVYTYMHTYSPTASLTLCNAHAFHALANLH